MRPSPSRPRVAALGPLHVEMIRWLRTFALGVENARPRSELLEHLVAWSSRTRGESGRPLDVPGPRLLIDSNDPDREMRGLAHECFGLGWAVLEGSRGYYYGRPDVARDWRGHRHRALRRLIAAARTLKMLPFTREAEARRRRTLLAGEPPRRWPAGHQVTLEDLLEEPAAAAAGVAS